MDGKDLEMVIAQAHAEGYSAGAKAAHRAAEKALKPTYDKHCQYMDFCWPAIAGDTVTLGFFYQPGSPGRMYMPNGDPGYPPDPEEFEIQEVWLRGVDICPILSEEQIEDIASAAIELHADQIANDHAEQRWEREQA
jgi:hypothetical protein